MKSQRIQKISSIIPFYSTFAILIITMVHLKRNKASKILWVCYFVIFFLSGIVTFIITSTIGKCSSILSVLVCGLLLAVSNFSLVQLQVKCKRDQPFRFSSTKVSINVPIAAWSILCLVVLCIVICVMLQMPDIDIEDLNGDEDTSLAVITISDVLSTDDEYSSYRTSTLYQGENSRITGKLAQYDYDNVIFRCAKISGVKTLLTTNTENNAITFEIVSTIHSGNLELFIIVDGEYYDSVKTNCTQTIQLSDISGKNIVIKIGAEQAAVDIEISRSIP